MTFFFSSRRRHTRWPRDWSSDVCSSDLYLFISCENGNIPALSSQQGGQGCSETSCSYDSDLFHELLSLFKLPAEGLKDAILFSFPSLSLFIFPLCLIMMARANMLLNRIMLPSISLLNP